jgi:hypothetical protein
VNIRAAGNVSIESTTIQTEQAVNVQSGGHLSIAGNYTHLSSAIRPEPGALEVKEERGVNFSSISAQTGITLGAVGGDLTVSATNIVGNAGPVTLQALGDINLEAAQSYRRRDYDKESKTGGVFNPTKTQQYDREQYLDNLPAILGMFRTWRLLFLTTEEVMQMM